MPFNFFLLVLAIVLVCVILYSGLACPGNVILMQVIFRVISNSFVEFHVKAFFLLWCLVNL